MTKEKRQSLTKYRNELADKLKEPSPDKHKDHPDTYKRFLENELAAVQSTLDKVI